MKYSRIYLFVVALLFGGIWVVVAGLDNEPTQKQLVTMYGTSWCGYCAEARQHFISNNIPFVEYDIEKDMQAKKRYDSFGGRSGIPTIIVGKKSMVGFSEEKFSQIYD